MIEPAQYNRDLKVRHARDEEIPFCGDLGTRAFNHPMHHTYKPGTTLVGEIEGKGITTCLCLRPQPGWWGDAQVPMSSIGSVATLPEERNQGYAGALMVGAVHILREMEIAASPLWPFSFAYYRKYGWELGSLDLEIMGIPSVLRSLAAGEGCRPAEDEDKPAVQAVYREFARRHNCGTVRPDAWWLEEEPGRESLYLVHINGEGSLDGYARYRTHWRHDEDGLMVDTLELATKSERVEAELASGLAGLPDVSRVRLLLPGDSSIPNFLPKRLQIQMAQRLQFRLLDVGRAVSALQPRPDLKGSIRFEIWDWVLSPDRPVPAVANVEGGRIELAGSHKKAPVVRTTVQVFSQIFSGLLRPAKAAAWGFLEVEDHATLKLADSLFYGRTPFRSAVEPG